MGEEINDEGKSCLDRIEEGLQMLAQKRLQFQEEYRKLLEGLELRQEPLQEATEFKGKLDESMARLAAGQRNADEKMAALMVTVKQFRRPLHSLLQRAMERYRNA